MKFMSNEWFVKRFMPFTAIAVNLYLIFFIGMVIYSEYFRK